MKWIKQNETEESICSFFLNFPFLSYSFRTFRVIPAACTLDPPANAIAMESFLSHSIEQPDDARWCEVWDDARCLQLLQLLYCSKDLKIQTIVYFCENTARLQALSNFYRTIDDSASNPAPSIVRVVSILVVSWVIWSAGVLNLFLQSFSVGDSTVIPLAAKESYRKGPTVVPLTSSFHHSKRAKASA